MNILSGDGNYYCEECGGKITSVEKYAGHKNGCSAIDRIKAEHKNLTRRLGSKHE